MAISGYSYEEAHPSPCTNIRGVPLPGRSCQRTRQFAVDEKKDSIELSILAEFKDVSIFALKPADKAQMYRFLLFTDHRWSCLDLIPFNEYTTKQAKVRDLALFNMALDSKLRGCDLVKLKVSDVAYGHSVSGRATVLQQKTGSPVQFELTKGTREAVAAWIKMAHLRSSDYLFQSRVGSLRHISTRITP